MVRRRVLWETVAVTLAVAFATACGPSELPRQGAARPVEVGYQSSELTALRDEGRTAYERHCQGCHGAKGDGAGEAARFLDPKPRNFIEADFKFSSTRSGELPTDADLVRSIKKGLRGSAMPTWSLLPDRTVDALVVYIKTFSPKWHDLGPSAPVPVVEDPYRINPDKSAAIARGEALYHGFAGCWNCHPSYVPEPRLREHLASFGNDATEVLRADLPHAVGKENGRGEMVYPPDFLRDFVRAGAGAEDIYRAVAAGITGTAMPTWVDSMDVPGASPGAPPVVERADLWAVSYYVQSLVLKRPAKLLDTQIDVRPRPRVIASPGAVTPQRAGQSE
jgi:mono/diheme cytochrome c family protein